MAERSGDGSPPARRGGASGSARHEPKLQALLHLQAGTLSSAGRQRLLRHVARCEACREALEGLRRFEQLAAADRPAALPALDWSRIEGAVLRDARERTRRRLAAVALPLLAAAAALVLVLPRWNARPPADEALAVERPPAPAPAPLEVRVTALIGSVQVRLPDGRREPLALDSRPEPGWTIETEAGSEAHLWLADTAQVLVGASSAVHLARLEPHAVELGVERGSAISKVRPLGTRRYEVTAAGYRAQVRGTHFSVAVHGTAAGVRVDEGHVLVLDGSGAQVADLIAPQDWASAPDASQRSHEPLRIPHAPHEGSTATLILPRLPTVAAWHVAGQAFATAGELQMRVPPGRLELAAELADGRLVGHELIVSPLGTRLDPSGLRLPRSSSEGGPRGEPGELDTAAASAVIRTAQPALQRCYERSLRTTDLTGSVKFKLRLSIDAAGRVRNSELDAAEPVPRDLAECVREATRGLLFPAPGGSGITFEAPLSFRTRR